MPVGVLKNEPLLTAELNWGRLTEVRSQKSEVRSQSFRSKSKFKIQNHRGIGQRSCAPSDRLGGIGLGKPAKAERLPRSERGYPLIVSVQICENYKRLFGIEREWQVSINIVVRFLRAFGESVSG